MVRQRLSEYLTSTNTFMADLLSPAMHARAVVALHKLANRHRRGADVSVAHIDGLIRVRCGSEHTYIPSLSRLPRYIWPEGLSYVFEKMARKYIRHFRDPLRPHETVIDVGANVGEFAMALVEQGSEELICFEPDPTVYRCLEKNTRSLKAVSTHSIALGATQEERTYFLAADSADSSLLEPDSYTGILNVLVERLDDVIRTHYSHLFEKGIGLLKMDAEGAEPEVLRGSTHVLTVTRRVAVDCSPERRGMSTRTEVEDLLRTSSFHILETKDQTHDVVIAERDN